MPIDGDVLSRRFRIHRIIGAGGMGIVVAAHHLALDKQVAIKLMRPELRTRTDFVRRFVREARAAARLDSRHVTRVFDAGTLEDGAPYIVMEYLEGTDLAAWLRQHGPMPVGLAAAIVSQASDAIAEAHAAGIVHRDLKPANLFLTRDADGELLVKVLDLGICKLLERSDDVRDTSTATPLGTLIYAAPEQLGASERADARSDIWSLGVILYELVTGHAPFHGRTVSEIRSRVMHGPRPALARPGLPVQLEAILQRCLEQQPAARYQRATDLAAALRPLVAGIQAPVIVARRPRRGHAIRRSMLAALGLAAVAVAVMVTWELAVSPEREPSAAALHPTTRPFVRPPPPGPSPTAAPPAVAPRRDVAPAVRAPVANAASGPRSASGDELARRPPGPPRAPPPSSRSPVGPGDPAQPSPQEPVASEPAAPTIAASPDPAAADLDPLAIPD
ncbi:MAG TPA: serine/threonine-protein kinase [Kofleriaceae bacterium]